MKNKHHHSKALLNSFPTNGHTLGFCLLNQKLDTFVSPKVEGTVTDKICPAGWEEGNPVWKGKGSSSSQLGVQIMDFGLTLDVQDEIEKAFIDGNIFTVIKIQVVALALICCFEVIIYEGSNKKVQATSRLSPIMG